MTTPMRRGTSKTDSQAVCHWCKVDLDDDSIWKTPLEGWEPMGTSGWGICGPGCPDKPQEAITYQLGKVTWKEKDADQPVPQSDG